MAMSAAMASQHFSLMQPQPATEMQPQWAIKPVTTGVSGNSFKM